MQYHIQAVGMTSAVMVMTVAMASNPKINNTRGKEPSIEIGNIHSQKWSAIFFGTFCMGGGPCVSPYLLTRSLFRTKPIDQEDRNMRDTTKKS